MTAEPCVSEIHNGNFEYMLVYNPDIGYCYMKKQMGFWQQCSKWYWHYGNLKRFNKEIADKPMYYTRQSN